MVDLLSAPISLGGTACLLQPSDESRRQIQYESAAAMFASCHQVAALDSTPKAQEPLPRGASTRRAHPYFHSLIDRSRHGTPPRSTRADRLCPATALTTALSASRLRRALRCFRH